MADVARIGWAAWAVLHFMIAVAGTWLARRYALRRQLLDQPGDRRSHEVPTPRGGGIAIVASLLLALGGLAVGNPGHAPMLLSTGLGVLLVAGIGRIADHRPLSPWPRLLVQCLAAGLLAWAIHMEGGSVLAVAAAFIAAMVLPNVWNFMDGIDGRATSQAVLAAIAYGVLAGQGAVAWIAMALAAACLGFLPFNLPRARIFLGDVGSGALGYALAVIAAWLALGQGNRLPLLVLPLSAFLIDASFTLAARIAAGKRWWLPHVEHAYQNWARHGRSHGRVTAAYAGWTVLACLLMLAGRTAAPAFIIPALLLVCLAGGGAWAFLRWTPQGQEDTKE